jgi:hypothetical protein
MFPTKGIEENARLLCRLYLPHKTASFVDTNNKRGNVV